MGVISFSSKPQGSLQIAGWAFRQILDDTSRLYPGDRELRELFENAKLYDGLSVEDLPDQIASRIVAGMRQIAEGVIAGTVTSGIEAQPYGDAATQDQYKSGLQDLLLVLADRK